MKQFSNVVILVTSTGHAIHLEKQLNKVNIPCKLIPVPRHLSSDCGVCVRIAPDARGQVEMIIHEKNIETEGVYEI